MTGQESGGSPQEQIAALYERMSAMVRDRVEKAGALTEESLERALRESLDWAARLKEQYGEDLPNVLESVRRDFREAVRAAREQTRKSLDLERIGAGLLGFVQRMAREAGSRLDSFAKDLDERLGYSTGEVAGPGTLTCLHCGHPQHFDAAARIPPCPKCHETSFRRGY